MGAAANEPVGAFVDACIEAPATARALAAADPTLLRAQWRGDPLLHWMVIEDFAAGVTTLLELGVPVDARDDDNQTALHYAARLGRMGCARLLLRSGADANALDDRLSENPLNLALAGPHFDVALLLLSHGARGDYLLPGLVTAFSTLAHLQPSRRNGAVELLAAYGITREGLFRSLDLARVYDSPEQAFGW